MKSILKLLLSVLLIGFFSISTTFAAGSSSSDEKNKNAHSKEYYKAVKLIKLENYDNAINILQALIKDNPNDADIHNYLGFSFRKMGQLEKSSYHYEKALKINPKHLGAL